MPEASTAFGLPPDSQEAIACSCGGTDTRGAAGFGVTGPRHAEPGYDYVLQGLAGWMELTGEPAGAPTTSGLSMVDYSGGFVAALSLRDLYAASVPCGPVNDVAAALAEEHTAARGLVVTTEDRATACCARLRAAGAFGDTPADARAT